MVQYTDDIVEPVDKSQFVSSWKRYRLRQLERYITLIVTATIIALPYKKPLLTKLWQLWQLLNSTVASGWSDFSSPRRFMFTGSGKQIMQMSWLVNETLSWQPLNRVMLWRENIKLRASNRYVYNIVYKLQCFLHFWYVCFNVTWLSSRFLDEFESKITNCSENTIWQKLICWY